MMEWTREAADEVLRLFLARTGLKNTKTKLISFRQTAIFYLADHDASLRVYGPGEDPVRAERMVQLARHLAGQDFPAIRPHAAFADQPFDIANLRASVWHWIEADDPMPKTDEMLGRLLRQLHDLPGSNALRLESFDPVATVPADPGHRGRSCGYGYPQPLRARALLPRTGSESGPLCGGSRRPCPPLHRVPGRHASRTAR